MSSVAYGALTRKREEAQSKESTTNEPPGLRPYVDALTALVPAEVLAAFAVLVPYFTSTTDGDPAADGSETVIVTITDPDAARAAFWILLVASMALYLLGRMKKFEWWDVARVFIPALAFVGWVMLLHPVVFAAAGRPWSTGMQAVIAVAGGLILGAAAVALGYEADKKAPKGQEKNPPAS